jgi:hypothetical protein
MAYDLASFAAARYDHASVVSKSDAGAGTVIRQESDTLVLKRLSHTLARADPDASQIFKPIDHIGAKVGGGCEILNIPVQCCSGHSALNREHGHRLFLHGGGSI